MNLVHCQALVNFAKHSKLPAIIDGESAEIITYGQLEKAIIKSKRVFETSKTLCFIFIKSTTENIIAYLSMMSLGHAVALFDADMHPDLKQRLVHLYQPNYIIDSLKASAPQINKDLYQIINSPFCSLVVWKHCFPEQVPKLHPKLQLLLSTSGTTGSPKLIRLTSENIVSNAHSICEYLNITHDDRAIASLPLHYSYGLSVLHTHLFAGASIILTSQSIIQEEFWQQFNRFQCTSLAGIPYTYQLLDRLGLDHIQCPSLKTLTQAGGRLSPILVAKFHALMEKRRGRFFTMYGQTEATARIAYLPPKYLPEKAGAIGIAIPDGKLEIFTNKEKVTAPFCEGELVYSGPNVMLGYAESADDLALGDQMHGVLRTGDLGYFDSEKIFYVTGRIKRISKAYGQRINLDDIEQAASSFGHFVVASDDNIIKLYYEKNMKVNQQGCSEYLTNTYHLPIAIFVYIEIEQFTLTSSGKIDYTKL